MKRFLTVILIIFTLISVFSLSCFAADNKDAEATAENENLFDVLYNELAEHSDKLLSALAFLASILVALTYKKGLLPILKGALNSLGATVSKLKEESERSGAEANAAILSASSKLAAAEKMIDQLTEKLDEIELQLEAANEERLSGESIYSVIRTQIDLLYEVFMSSSLPAYQKEAIGEKVNEMKKSLSASSDKAVNSDYE